MPVWNLFATRAVLSTFVPDRCLYSSSVLLFLIPVPGSMAAFLGSMGSYTVVSFSLGVPCEVSNLLDSDSAGAVTVCFFLVAVLVPSAVADKSHNSYCSTLSKVNHDAAS